MTDVIPGCRERTNFIFIKNLNVYFMQDFLKFSSGINFKAT